MADVDIDSFGEHESRSEEPTGENIPLIPVGRSTWEPECEQEASFRGESQRTRLLKDYVKDLYKKLSESRGKTPEGFRFDDFELRDGKLYYKDKSKSLMTRGGELRLVGEIEKILGKKGLRDLGFDSEVTAQEAAMLNRVEEELPSASDIAKTDDIELQEIVKNTEDLIAQWLAMH